MENIDILQSKIVELEELLEEKDNFILQQQTLINQLLTEKQFNSTPTPYGDCPSGGWHEYPNPWHSITAPCCKKCGQPSPFNGFTWSSTRTDLNTNFTSK